MRFSFFMLILLCGLAFFLTTSSCNKRISDSVETVPPVDVTSFGRENTLEIISWNIEFFPKPDNSTAQQNNTISKVKDIILGLDADIYAVQEITGTIAFERLIDSLNAFDPVNTYDGILNLQASFLLTGVIYKSNVVSVLNSDILSVDGNDGCDFAGRPPFLVEMRTTRGGMPFDFTLVVVHLKAQRGNPGDCAPHETRRRNAIVKINDYINDRLLAGQDPDFVVAGDWNDLLDDSGASNVFSPFLDDSTTYRFLTEPFAGSATEYTFIGGSFRSLLDHIMITRTIEVSYPGIVTEILKIDQEFNGYIDQVSDHRPVGSRIAVF